MDDTLKRLIEAESRAEQMVQEAKLKREEVTRKALDEARHAEQRFADRVPELHASFLEKAEARAEQTIHELQRRYDERNKALRAMAETREQEAIEAALQRLLDGAETP